MIKLDILLLLFLQKHLVINGRHHIPWLLNTHVSPTKREIYWYNSIIEKMVHIWISLSLSIIDLYNNHKTCNPESNPWPCIAFSCHINLVFFHTELFLGLSLSFITLTCFKSTEVLFYSCLQLPHSRSYMTHLLQEYDISHVVFFSGHHIMRPWCCFVPSLVMFALITHLRYNPPGFPTLKGFFPLVFSMWSMKDFYLSNLLPTKKYRGNDRGRNLTFGSNRLS